MLFLFNVIILPKYICYLSQREQFLYACICIILPVGHRLGLSVSVLEPDVRYSPAYIKRHRARKRVLFIQNTKK